MARAAPEQEQVIKKKKPGTLDEQFAAFMRQPLPKVTQAELDDYAKLATKQPALSWRVFLKQVLESPLPAEPTLEGYVKAAISQTPVPVNKEPSSVVAMKDMVAKKTPSEAKLTDEAVGATLKLALLLETQDIRKMNFRKWCGEEGKEAVV
jgi:hypothetical protein